MAKKVPSIIDLLKNPNINEKILSHFAKLTTTSDEKPIDLKNRLRKLELTNYPFNSNLYDSYIMNWELLTIHKLRKNNFLGCSPSLLEAYLKRYAQGFKFGYSNFEKDILKVKTQIFKSDENRAQVIFDYASMPYPEMTPYKLQLSCYKNSLEAYEIGIKRGYYYRAWYLVLENHKYFEGFFNKLETEDELEKLTFVTSFSAEQLTKLCKELKGVFIDKNTDCNLFKAVFDDEPLNKLSGKIKWILHSKQGKPHKTALREFLTFLLGKSPNQQVLNYCISDANGDLIELAKKHAPSNYYNDLESIITKI